jgi:glyoxylase I family protein
MAIDIKTPCIHHLSLRSTDLARSRRFYADILGFPVVLETPGLFLFLPGSTAIGMRGPDPPTPANDVFSPFRTGLDHLALACADERELRRGRAGRSGCGQHGCEVDPTLNRSYVAFKDPDRIAWELYLASDGAAQA